MLAIIVPYRDRTDHLFAFLVHMQRYFAGRTDVSFHIVEQAGHAPFNRGKLCNAGYLLAREQADNFCFHDVDFLPIKADYSFPQRPARLVLPTRMITPTHGYRENQEDFFGAVVMFNATDFEDVNGFPNCYWGWGPEDRELGLRCSLAGRGFDRRDGEFHCLPHVHAGLKDDGGYNDTADRNWQLFEGRRPHLRDLMAREGARDCQFRSLRRSGIDINGANLPRTWHHFVELTH